MMAVNRDRPDRWKADIAQSVDMYNDWFLEFAPAAYRKTRVQTTSDVEATLKATANLTDIGVALLRRNPGVLPTLRMATCPPLAVDRLIGLSGVPSNLVKVMEKDGRLPLRMSRHQADMALGRIAAVIQRMADPDILVWLETGKHAFGAGAIPSGDDYRGPLVRGRCQPHHSKCAGRAAARRHGSMAGGTRLRQSSGWRTEELRNHATGNVLSSDERTG